MKTLIEIWAGQLSLDTIFYLVLENRKPQRQSAFSWYKIECHTLSPAAQLSSAGLALHMGNSIVLTTTVLDTQGFNSSLRPKTVSHRARALE